MSIELFLTRAVTMADYISCGLRGLDLLGENDGWNLIRSPQSVFRRCTLRSSPLAICPAYPRANSQSGLPPREHFSIGKFLTRRIGSLSSRKQEQNRVSDPSRATRFFFPRLRTYAKYVLHIKIENGGRRRGRENCAGSAQG